VSRLRPGPLLPLALAAACFVPALAHPASPPRDSTVNLPPWTRPTTWDIEIATPGEPGPRFEMSGRVLGVDSIPQRGVHLYVYHADSMGWYARRGQKFNRIAGVLETNDRGEYRFRSILPGTYEGARHPHVHLELWKGTHVVSTQWVSLYNNTWSFSHSPHGGSLTLDSAGVYHCRYDLMVPAMFHPSASYDSFMQAERKKLEHGSGR
jgi:hypothetical protein